MAYCGHGWCVCRAAGRLLRVWPWELVGRAYDPDAANRVGGAATDVLEQRGHQLVLAFASETHLSCRCVGAAVLWLAAGLASCLEHSVRL